MSSSPVPPRPPWRQQLHAAIEAAGFVSLSAFADAFPQQSLEDLTDALGVSEVSVMDVESELLEESVEDPVQLSFRARDLLFRSIASLPSGWPGPPQERSHAEEALCTTTLARWLPIDIGTEYQEGAVRISVALLGLRSLERGWRPKDAADPVLVALFEEHWRVSSPRSAG